MESVILILAVVAAGTAFTALLGTVMNALTAPRLHRQTDSETTPPVTLIVPARNEALNLETLLPCLQAQDYPNLEILLLDDGSEDGTGEKAAAAGVRVIRGSALPPGWLGKPWACAQAAVEAKAAAPGKEGVLIFCDADARPGPKAVRRTVAFLLDQKADCATAMPRSLLGSWAEKAVIPPLLHTALLGFLPIALIPRRPEPLLSAANGQWLAFTRRAYDALGGHRAVKDRIVEDMAFARLVKARGFRLALALATRDLEVRMYRNAREVREGFGKNLFFLTGRNPLRFAAFLAFHTVTQILPWFLPLFGHFEFLPALGAILLQRWLGAFLLREPWDAWLWHPVGTLLIPAIAWRSAQGLGRGSLVWKGRALPASGPQEDFFETPNAFEKPHSARRTPVVLGGKP